MQVNNVAWVECKFIDDRMDSSSYITQINMGLFDLYKKESTDFQIKTLDDICNKIIDGPFGSDILEEDYVEQGVPFIRVQNITEYGFEDSNLVFISEKANKRIIRSECRPGDLVFTKTGRLGTVCVLNNEYSNYNIRGDLAKLQLKSHIDPYYVMSYLNSNFGTKITNSYSSGSTRGRILISNIKKIFTPIPSPEIQKYIGNKVRKAEELREEAKRLKKEAEDLLYEVIELKPSQELGRDMFTFVKGNYIDSERLDSEYYKTEYIALEKLLKTKRVICLKDILIENKYGASVEADYAKVGIPFIRGNNLTDNEINMDDIVCLNKKLKDEVKNHIVNTGDILITRSGTVGISAVVDEKCDGFSFGSFMIKLGIDTRLWNPYYIAAFLNSYWGKWQIARLQNGAVQQNINMQEIGRIMISIVTKENQDNIGESIKNYINQKRQSKQLIKEAKQDVEDLIEGNFDMSKIKVNN
jgi:type I restriction enzyme S subunit